MVSPGGVEVKNTVEGEAPWAETQSRRESGLWGPGSHRELKSDREGRTFMNAVVYHMSQHFHSSNASML